jgi:predicted glycogen debranching enzyme
LVIQFDKRICCDLDAALSREWLETNGLGGFASSTIIGLNTRRYHGLLVAATKPPAGRMLLLSKLEETVVVGGNRYELGANQYPGVIHPTGYQYLREFRLDPFPVFTYDVGDCEIVKSVFMIQGQNSTVVQYKLRRTQQAESGDVFLEVRPLIGFRDSHGTTHENSSLNTEISVEDGIVSLSPYPGLPHLYLAHDGNEVQLAGHWYRNFEYQVERKRGLEFVEDLFNPFVIRFEMTDRAEASIIASTEPREASPAADFREAEIHRRETLASSAPQDHELIRTLAAAADQFIVERGSLKTVIAGYHWFGDWGRDTMIALPGLTLVTGRHDVARGILLEFARYVDRGMLPNRFPDQGEEPEYNTVDATLWFFEAVRSLAQYTGDLEFIRARLYPVLTDIIEWHVRGSRYGIRVDSDGLLNSGEPGVQLTWMDAKVGDWVVTPRSGKPVEIQALWYHALRVLEELAHSFGDDAGRARYRAMADSCKENFNLIFWNQDIGCLYDCIDGDDRDGSIRPNQIIAVSLRHSMVSMDKAQRIVDVVERKLLTPVGLRSLAPGDPGYHPRYEGGILERDSAYHQGTVWSWLMGPFITAYVKAHGRGKKARRKAAGWLDGFRAHLSEAGLGQVSEIFDAEPPYTPRGCIGQAWSVGELLRAAIEDIY